MQGESDLISGDAYSVDDLRNMVFNDGGRPIARWLSSCSHKRTMREKPPIWNDFSWTNSKPPPLRNQAAKMLGDMTNPDAARALERGVRLSNDLALRGVIDGLECNWQRAGKAACRELAGATRSGGRCGESSCSRAPSQTRCNPAR